MRFPIDAAPPPSDATIEAFEKRLGHALPEAQRRLLTEIGNGGVVEWMAMPDDGIGWVLLFGIDTDEPARDLAHNLATFRDRVHPEFFPFGSTVGGDLVCLSMRDDDRDSVWFWDHEMAGSQWKRTTMRPLVFVTDTIDQFLAQDYTPITAPAMLARPTTRFGRLVRVFFGR